MKLQRLLCSGLFSLLLASSLYGQSFEAFYTPFSLNACQKEIFHLPLLNHNDSFDKRKVLDIFESPFQRIQARSGGPSGHTNLKLIGFHTQSSWADLKIEWEQSRASQVFVRLYDAADQPVLQIEAGEFPAGKNELHTNLSNLLPGLYQYELQAGEEKIQHQVMIMQ